MAGSVVNTHSVILSDIGGCRGYYSLTNSILSGHLLHLTIWLILFLADLANLWAVVHTICLLEKEHISMVMRCLHYFGSGSAARHTLICWRRTHRNILMIVLVIVRFCVLCLLGTISISCSEASKPARVHLFLHLKPNRCIVFAWLLLELLIVKIMILIVFALLFSLTFKALFDKITNRNMWVFLSIFIIHWLFYNISAHLLNCLLALIVNFDDSWVVLVS